MGRSSRLLGSRRESLFFAIPLALALPGVAVAERTASASEVQVATGAVAQGSSWSGDASVGTSLKIGMRFADLVAIDALARLGYATVDTRMLTYLSLGSTIYGRLGRVRPYGRLSIVHQHEEPVSALRNDPFGAVFGVGDGIRHRGGFGSSLGVDVVVAKGQSVKWLVGADLNGTWFPDPRGPSLYYGGGLWAGLDYAL